MNQGKQEEHDDAVILQRDRIAVTAADVGANLEKFEEIAGQGENIQPRITRITRIEEQNGPSYVF